MTEASAPEQLVLIDGSGYIFRAFHALPMMMSPEGVPVNAVFGFTKMLMKLMDDLQPSHVLVIFDAGRVTFRNDIYPEYKQNRTDPPDELVPQFSLVRDATEAMSLPVTELPGFEADDLIASYAKMAHESGTDCLIVSSDKDLMQLVRPGVTMLDPMKQRRISDAEVVEKFGVLPNRVVDVQSLAGDSTDNVPGVPGIGIKTAAELINQFGDLDSLLAGAETIKQPKRRENLVNFAEQARISRELVRLKDDVPLDNNIASLVRPHRDMDRLSAFLSGQGFNSLLASIGAKNAASQKTAPTSGKPDSASPFGAILPPHVEAPSYELVITTDALSRWIDEARSQGFIAIDTETTSLNASSASLVGVALATAPGKACYIPLRHVAPASEGAAQGGLDFAGDAEVAETVMLEQMDEAEALSLLRGLCAATSKIRGAGEQPFGWWPLIDRRSTPSASAYAPAAKS